MKKRIVSIVMLTVLLISLVSMAGCGLPAMIKMKTADHTYGYSHCTTASEFSSMYNILHFIYVDTSLYISDDGTWMIAMDETDFISDLLVDGVIDEGTYTEENGVYTFVGFEDDFDATGSMQGDGFVIDFVFPDQTGNIVTAYSLHFGS